MKQETPGVFPLAAVYDPMQRMAEPEAKRPTPITSGPRRHNRHLRRYGRHVWRFFQPTATNAVAVACCRAYRINSYDV